MRRDESCLSSALSEFSAHYDLHITRHLKQSINSLVFAVYSFVLFASLCILVVCIWLHVVDVNPLVDGSMVSVFVLIGIVVHVWACRYSLSFKILSDSSDDLVHIVSVVPWLFLDVCTTRTAVDNLTVNVAVLVLIELILIRLLIDLIRALHLIIILQTRLRRTFFNLKNEVLFPFNHTDDSWRLRERHLLDVICGLMKFNRL